MVLHQERSGELRGNLLLLQQISVQTLPEEHLKSNVNMRSWCQLRKPCPWRFGVYFLNAVEPVTSRKGSPASSRRLAVLKFLVSSESDIDLQDTQTHIQASLLWD